jgi:excisionase family DNA binding protein
MVPNDLIDAKAGARLVGVHVSTIYRWVLTGRLRGYRVGSRYRVSRAAVLGMVVEVRAPAVAGSGHAEATAYLREAGAMR